MAKFETRAARTQEDRLVEKFTPPLAARRRRYLKSLHAQDLDLSPSLIRELVNERMRQWARLGGLARARALSPARRREIARKANAARNGGQK